MTKKVLLLHGFMSSADSYFLPAVKKHLQAHAVVYNPSLPDPDVPLYASWKECVLESISEREFDIIIAHSLGGTFAMNLISEGAIDTRCLFTFGSSFGPKGNPHMNTFVLSDLSLERLKDIEYFYAFASYDDPWTHFEYSVLTAKQCGAINVFFADQGHFEVEVLPDAAMRMIDSHIL